MAIDHSDTTVTSTAPHAHADGLPLRDRITLWTSLTAITALAWLYLIRMPMTPGDLGGVAARILSAVPAQWATLWLIFMMWAVMMAAMMIPSASPMILTYARIARSQGGTITLRVTLFAAGYLAAWTIFSAVATAVQAGLAQASVISNSLSTTPLIGAAILLAAGLYQLTPLKRGCLSGCQSPIGFLMTHWRGGAAGAFRMGMAHGTFCIGCCWLLMALLFVAGVMNLVWVAAITVFVLLERATRYGRAIANVSGVALIAAAIVMAMHR
jgi:predicted metal-binding membrane protein